MTGALIIRLIAISGNLSPVLRTIPWPKVKVGNKKKKNIKGFMKSFVKWKTGLFSFNKHNLMVVIEQMTTYNVLVGKLLKV